MDIKRGDWVRHRRTGRVGRVEAIGDGLASIASWPDEGDGWVTGLAAGFEPASAGAGRQPVRQQAT